MTRARSATPSALVLSAALVANLAIGAGLGSQRGVPAAVALALVPTILFVVGALIATHRDLLVYIALALTLTGLNVTSALPGTGGVRIFATDIILLLAIGAAIGGWLMPRQAGAQGTHMRTPVLGIPLLFLVATLTLGIVKGHERYGASLVGQPARLFLYAAIAVAMVGLTPQRAWKGITIVFYAGAVVQALWGVYYMATGRSQTGTEALSTGGLRFLALSSSLYLTGSLLCALLNLERHRDRVGRQLLDAVIALLSIFGIVVAFGRAVYFAVVVIVPLLLITRRELRRSVVRMLPIFAPVLILVALLVPLAKPDLVTTLTTRLTKTNGNELNVVWRQRARAAAMQGVGKEIVTGVGFGRITSFQIAGQTVKIDGDPHNSYVYLLAGGGLLALCSMLLVGIFYLFDAWRRIRATSGVSQMLVIWCVGTWLSFMINALAEPILTDATMLLTIWITLLLPAIVVRRPTVDESRSPSPEAQLESSLVRA